ncbi:hypothetical protein [Dongia sp.]|uniref:hypothetical protein n=1 Tax=Dongia sp. TaxID=1977262 RepID=UPI0035B4E124
MWSKEMLKIGALALVLGLSLGSMAEAKSRQVNGSVILPNGGTVTKEGDVQGNGDGSWSRNKTVTGPNGETVTKSVEGSCVAGSGCSKSVTGFNGETRHVTSTGSVESDGSGNGSWSRSKTVTGADGATATKSVSGSCSGGESCNSTATATGPNGKTVTRQRWITVE